MSDTVYLNGKRGQAYPTGGRDATIILILLCLTYLFDYADRMVIASLLSLIKQDWAITDQAAGMLKGVVNIFIAIFVLPFSFLIDRWSRRKMVSLMVFFWSLATLACAFTQNYNQLLIARAFTGIGEAGYAPAAVAIIAAAFSRKERAKYTGIWDAFAPMGAAIGIIVGGYVGVHYGWRHALGLVAIPGVVLSVIFWFTKDYGTVSLVGKTESRNGKAIDIAGAGKEIFKLGKVKTLWFVYGGFAMNLAVNTSILFWMPSYFEREIGLSEQQASAFAGGMAMLALVGAPLGGILADRLTRKYRAVRMVLSGITSLMSAIFLFIALVVPGFSVSIVFFLLFGILTVAFLGPASAVVQDVVHPGVRAMAFGLNVVCMNVFGSSWSPVVIGSLSDKYGLSNAFLLLPFFGLLAGIFFLVGARFYLKDLKNVKRTRLFVGN